MRAIKHKKEVKNIIFAKSYKLVFAVFILGLIFLITSVRPCFSEVIDMKNLTVYTIQEALFYIDSENGDDTRDGLSPETAWQTISKVNNTQFGPGSQILFKRGCAWREELLIPCSGEIGNPIIFAAYGTGKKPVINGADIINGWSLYNSEKNIYVAEVNSEVTQLFVDENRQTLARWPNKGWLTIDMSSDSNKYLYSEDLTQPNDYWTNAKIVIRSSAWYIEVRTITGNNGNIFTWDINTVYRPRKGYGFYLEDKLEEIDIPGEWVYKDGKVYLSLEFGDLPENHLIEGTLRTGIVINPNEKYIEIKDLEIKNTNTGILANNSDFITIRDNLIYHTQERGLLIENLPVNSHGHIWINNNTINQTQSDGIRIRGIDFAEITNNKIMNIAVNTISPKNGDGISVSYKNKDILISNNTLENICHNGMFIGEPLNCTISNNYICNCLLLLSDGGGIYNSQGKGKNLIIKNNIIKNIKGNPDGDLVLVPRDVTGIYIDEGANGVLVQGNIVINSNNYGLTLHKVFNNTIVNNVFYNCGQSAVRYSETAPNQMYGNNMYNNILIGTTPDQLTFWGTRLWSSTIPMGEYDYNIHFNPYRENTIKYDDWKICTENTLEDWKNFTRQAENSIFGNPLFVNPEQGDFHLKSNSPAINKGVDVGLLKDFDGTSIPQGPAPDIGAYEFITHYNQPPVFIPINPQTVDEEEQLNVYIHATDPEENSLSFLAQEANIANTYLSLPKSWELQNIFQFGWPNYTSLRDFKAPSFPYYKFPTSGPSLFGISPYYGLPSYFTPYYSFERSSFRTSSVFPPYFCTHSFFIPSLIGYGFIPTFIGGFLGISTYNTFPWR